MKKSVMTAIILSVILAFALFLSNAGAHLISYPPGPACHGQNSPIPNPPQKISISDILSGCGSEGTMECDDSSGNSCKHRTCQGSGEWGSWATFQGSYSCVTASSGGQKCAYKKACASF